ncbi:AaceriACL031Cp [[Ashbya] aceris (nom. inval.)]|nr:AaceriACL031Cp [[Ashbya] aceris (nom. inval.)]
MLRNSFRSASKLQSRNARLLRAAPLLLKRPLSNDPSEVFTKLTDENDPQRDAFFKYGWGSWLKNDKQEKEKRVTRFSIEGLNKVLSDLHEQSAHGDEAVKTGAVPPPSYNPNLTVSLPHNVTSERLGLPKSGESVRVVSMASFHEGKHHRIYKIDTNAGKSFVLRIPYAIDEENTLAYRVKSEVATMDFADLKLGMNVPKVFCFGVNALNPIRQPFILEEYVPGRLLMKDWMPLANDSADGSHNEKLNTVIDPISEFQTKLAETEFTAFGSLYFAKDYRESDAPAYKSETDSDLADRWRIGPSVERCFWRKKSALPFEQRKKYLGPWAISQPLDIVKSLGLLEAENSRVRLAMKQADASPEAEVDEQLLRDQITTFENLAKLAPAMYNLETKSIPNMDAILKPRLCHPDLDPMNVILHEENGKPYLLDFEGTTVKPFILHNNPQFVAYDGPKVYDLERDVENYNKLSDQEKDQYEFMYKRTRNQYLWESKLNQNAKHLISSIAPLVKLLRSPYVYAVQRKYDQEYLLIDEAFVQLKEVWELFAKNGLTNSEQFPIEFTEEWLRQHAEKLNAYHEKLLAEPFSATQGWMPQDLFDNLVNSGVLVKDANGDHSLKQ